MKQLGKLAVICAQRNDVLLEVLNGYVKISVGWDEDREFMNADWADNKAIKKMIHKLNFGKYSKKL